MKKKSFINDKIKSLYNTSFFKIIIDYYFQFKNNNFFINIMIDLIKIIFDNDKAPEELITNFLQLYNQNDINKDNNFITLLMNDLIKNTKFTFENSNNIMNSLLFGSNLTILNYIFSSKNPYIANINEKLPKEKFFYENFIVNINYIFSKKLYKISENTDKPDFDALGVRLNSLNGNQGNSDIPFSVLSLNDVINFYLKVNEKYLAGEEYMSLFKEREKRIEEIKKSNEYIRLGNQKKDKENNEKKINKEETNKEEANKEEKNKEEINNEESNKEGKNNDNINDNINDNNKIENNDIENTKYNDVNYWHTEIKDESMDNILEELL